jgi:uncharacterized protein YyaL (SSP411 family)
MNNPVAWQMWTAEALSLAKKHDRLLFVSIGYAACHCEYPPPQSLAQPTYRDPKTDRTAPGCHVMERESFSHPEIAQLLNKSFIPIKLDREERPDIDRIYMNYVQATTGSGGWPLNVFLTPDLEPLFGGTYWPGPGSEMITRRQHVGFQGILHKIEEAWRVQRGKCVEDARQITEKLRRFAQEGTVSRDGTGGAAADEEGEALDLELLDDAYEHLAARYDEQHGGFSKAPKFPTPPNLRFLLRLGAYPEHVRDVVGEEECKNAKAMVLHTLKEMARGGIHDQVGNGFARYSVTRDWSLPHFEKMLYDQGQLLQTYVDAYLITKDSYMLEQVHDIATYLTTPPLHSPQGGFYTAEDADSLYRPTDLEKREGAFYVWTLKELQQVLGERDAGVLAKYYDVHDNGNVAPEHDAHDELINQNVLKVRSTPEALAKEFGLSKEEVDRILKEGRLKLLAHRNKERPRPLLDDKIVVAWNGLAIGALARTSAMLQALDPDDAKAKTYLEAAKKAADFVRKELYDEESGTMKRVYREGPGDAPAFADDYAFLISGLIDLYEATFDDTYLSWADRLQKTELQLFWDESHGGFFSTPEGQIDLILRLKDGMDNAEPSTNGVSAQNLNRLASLLEDEDYRKKASKTLGAFEAEVMQHPFLFVGLMDTVVVARLGMKGIAITGEGKEVEDALKTIRLSLGTTRTVARLGDGAKSEWLRARNELLKTMDPKRKMIQVCEAGTCKEVLGMEDVEKTLQ